MTPPTLPVDASRPTLRLSKGQQLGALWQDALVSLELLLLPPQLAARCTSVCLKLPGRLRTLRRLRLLLQQINPVMVMTMVTTTMGAMMMVGEQTYMTSFSALDVF